MTPESVMTIGGHAMQVTLMVAAPVLVVVLVDWFVGEYFPSSYTN